MTTIAIGKFLQAIEEPAPQRKTKVFSIHTAMTGAQVGKIQWFSHWRRYWFETQGIEVGFDATCLRDLADFCDQLMGERITDRPSEKRQQLKG